MTAHIPLDWTLRRRHLAVGATTAVAMLVFVPLVGRLGAMGGAVALAPSLAAGMLLGMRGGLVWSAFVCVAMNIVLRLVGAPIWSPLELGMGIATLLASGGLAGRLKDLSREIANTERQRVLAETRVRVATSERLASLGTLAASIAHEINNPMAFVLTNVDFTLEMLAEPNIDLAEIRSALADAKEGAKRVLSIVSDMRNLSRGTDEALREIDVSAAVRSAINLAGPSMKRSVTLQLELGDVPPVLATEARLGQVVLNLIVNAAQAMPERLASANRIRVVTRTDEAGRAVIEVQDNGTGIPKDVAPRIFDPFFTTKPAGVGTGLGLSICHSIIDTLGGELSFVSEADQGTTFRVVLPPADRPNRVKSPSDRTAASVG
jgi:signal transduction histidine kinase